MMCTTLGEINKYQCCLIINSKAFVDCERIETSWISKEEEAAGIMDSQKG